MTDLLYPWISLNNTFVLLAIILRNCGLKLKKIKILRNLNITEYNTNDNKNKGILYVCLRWTLNGHWFFGLNGKLLAHAEKYLVRSNKKQQKSNKIQ